MTTRRVILARHGNTFNPADPPVWVGARTDLPLVGKGLAQARSLADALQQAPIVPAAIIAGPLRRTRQTADIVAEKFPAVPVRIDPRLREIDYGAWEGLSSEAIIAAGFEAELSDWNRQSLFPASPGWQPAEAQIRADTEALLNESTNGTTLIVTSNGILRFFAAHAGNATAFPDRKVATGHLCVMEWHNDGWTIQGWNQPPVFLISLSTAPRSIVNH